MTTPKTPEEWAKQYLKECDDLPNDDHMPLFIDIIRRATEQSFTDGYQAGQVAGRRDAIAECIKTCDDYLKDCDDDDDIISTISIGAENIRDKLRALLTDKKGEVR